MDLFIYPQAASYTNGYGIGVNYAYEKITPKPDDIVVWYTSEKRDKMLYVRDSDVIIRRKRPISFAAIRNLFRGKTHAELTAHDLSFLRDMQFDYIHCDEVIFYRALRKLFPDKKLTVRFHNCFSRIWVRTQFLNRPLGFKYWLNIKLLKKLETEIFADRKVHKIFISDEDRDFYCSNYGITSDSETWYYLPDINLIQKNRSEIVLDNKIVWFGGMDTHKISSVKWFASEVFPLLLKFNPKLEFHLWGGGTEFFNRPQHRIFGHGFFEGEGLPSRTSLYVNPDIIGGGIKLKIMSLLENGAVVITSPFGFEGYKKDLIDNKYCYVVEEGHWLEVIENILTKYSISSK